MAFLEYYISNGGTNQPSLATYNEQCKEPPPDPNPGPNPSPVPFTPPEWCATYLIGKNWSFDPYYFNSKDFGSSADPIPVGNLKVGIRCYDEETIFPGQTNPITGETTPGSITRNYVDWVLVKQEMSVSLSGDPADRNIFQTTPNERWWQLIEPGTYDGDGILAPYQYAGILDGAEYQYGGIFNEGNISYIPRLSPGSQPPVKGSPPSSPYDTEEGIYPINTLCGYSKDPRAEVSLVYTISTTWYPKGEPGDEMTSIINISQSVYQDANDTDYSDEIEEALNRAYYTYDDYQVFLWPVDEPPLYNEDGSPIPPVPRYNPRTDSYYDQETNGEGFKTLDEDVPQ